MNPEYDGGALAAEAERLEALGYSFVKRAAFWHARTPSGTDVLNGYGDSAFCSRGAAVRWALRHERALAGQGAA